MGLVGHLAKEVVKEIGNKSREFYEFVLPPIDMYLEDDNLIVIIDIPGFDKKEIKLTIHDNILSVTAEKKQVDNLAATPIWKQRPNIIDKRIRLPITIKKEEENISSAKYSQGVLTIKIPISDPGKKITIE